MFKYMYLCRQQRSDSIVKVPRRYAHVCMCTAESFSERVSELTHPKLPIYSFEIIGTSGWVNSDTLSEKDSAMYICF